MHTTATLHVHPTCASNRQLIEQLQTTTGCTVIVHHGKPKLVARRYTPAPFDPNDGGRAA
ncbi:hypothetical protein [Pseudomonas sp. NA-150]|uniref:hypothetical protein n=1 Tax=Pseudomonas sp. NA-150 TaxID=3367525 RepID=UPI0037C5F34F